MDISSSEKRNIDKSSLNSKTMKKGKFPSMYSVLISICFFSQLCLFLIDR